MDGRKTPKGVYFSLDSIVELLSNKPRKKVSVGFRPSGQIHLGNISTLLLASWLTHYLGTSTTELEITVLDIDLPSESKGKIAYPFKYIKSPLEEYPNLAAYSTAKVKEFMSLVQAEIGINYHFNWLSDIQSTVKYRNCLETLIKERDTIKKILTGDESKNRKIPIHPICPKCHTVTRTFPVLAKGKNDRIEIEADCNNEACDQKRYKFDLYDRNISISAHYLINSIRDIVTEPQTDVHVYGGDYFESHAGELSKVEKAKKITTILANKTDSLRGTKVPIYLIGPLFYGEDGEKMSKSNLKGLTFDELKEHFANINQGKSWVRRTLEFVKYLINERVKRVDYSITRQHLLGGDLTKGNLN